MIITWLTGGLGNQMFQYAAGLALAHQRRTVLKLDVSWFKEYPNHESHNRYALDCFNITEQFATQEEIDRLKGVPLTRVEKISARWARRLHLYQYAARLERRGNWHPAKDFRFYPEFFDLPDDTYLEGMWQSEEFFRPISELLRLHFSFRFPPSAETSKTLKIIESGPCAAVHVRRGDYVRNAQFAREIGALDFQYYYRAIETLQKAVPGIRFFVFSDEIDAVEKEFRPPAPCYFVRATGMWNAFDELRLISCCNHAIVANSSFSWWGAWLIRGAEKLVVAPDPWFAGGTPDSSKVVPDGWLRIPARV